MTKRVVDRALLVLQFMYSQYGCFGHKPALRAFFRSRANATLAGFLERLLSSGADADVSPLLPVIRMPNSRNPPRRSMIEDERKSL